MGSAQAHEMVSILPREQALICHLRYNHYPPIPSVMVPTCIAAIEAAEAGDWDQEVELPEGITHRNYGESAPARTIIEYAHLESFIDTGDNED